MAVAWNAAISGDESRAPIAADFTISVCRYTLLPDGKEFPTVRAPQVGGAVNMSRTYVPRHEEVNSKGEEVCSATKSTRIDTKEMYAF